MAAIKRRKSKSHGKRRNAGPGRARKATGGARRRGSRASAPATHRRRRSDGRGRARTGHTERREPFLAAAPAVERPVQEVLRLTREGADWSMHSAQVARSMARWAPLVGVEPDRAAVCGWLHDIGRSMDGGDEGNHAELAGGLLRGLGYADWEPVALHGTPEGLGSPLGLLLGMADMTTLPSGAFVEPFDVLEDAGRRFGPDSERLALRRAVMDRLRQDPACAAIGAWEREHKAA